MSDDKTKLDTMIDSIVAGNPEQAQVDFHDYLQDKMRDVLGTDPHAPIEEPTTTEKEKTDGE